MPARDAGPTGVLLLDKPAGITSTRALAVARRLLGSRKAGHTGTLDPFATGLLPLAFGEATKFSRFLLDSAKRYDATLRLGYTSSTGDPEGTISRCGLPATDIDRISDVVASFVGDGTQVPPMHSALHHGGRRLYEWARSGEEVPRQPRSITVHQIELVSISGENLLISVKCSKGTYIRTLAEDIGRKLGCGAYLVALRRTEVGAMKIRDAVSLEALEASGPGASWLRPPESLTEELPRCTIEDARSPAFLQGQKLACDGPRGDVAVFSGAGRFLGVALRDGSGTLSPVRLMSAGAATDAPDFA